MICDNVCYYDCVSVRAILGIAAFVFGIAAGWWLSYRYWRSDYLLYIMVLRDRIVPFSGSVTVAGIPGAGRR